MQKDTSGRQLARVGAGSRKTAAHEIRNPVAMIAARVSTAKQLPGTEREDVFEIASDETARLSQLTTGFLDYASARQPKVANVFP
jgi:signal transduction histidine kinase